MDAAVAVLDDGVGAEPGDVPGGPLGGLVPDALDIDPEETVEKIGRTTGHTHGRITAVEVDGVAVQYDDVVLPLRRPDRDPGARRAASAPAATAAR